MISNSAMTTAGVPLAQTAAGRGPRTFVMQSGRRSLVRIATFLLVMMLAMWLNPAAAETIAYRVNAGGPALAGTPGWESDTPSPYVNTGATAKSFSNVALNHPSMPPETPKALFDTERWDKPASPEMQWDFPVTPGTYEVRLYFAETYSGTQSVGARVFDVLIEGASVLDDYDIYADVGGNKAVMKSFMVTADANLDIDFLHVVQNPAVKGIEIIQGDPGQLGVSPGSVDFGPVLVGSNGFESIELTNLGGSGDPDIEVQSAQMTGTDASEFSHDLGGPVTLSPGQSTLVGVTFGPLSDGAKSASLSISHDGMNTPVVVPLEGSGAMSSSELGTSPSSVDFGSVAVGTSKTDTVTIANAGQAGDPAIEVQSTQMSGVDAGQFVDDFSGPLVLSPGESATIDVTFVPSSSGGKTASMEIIHDGANSPVMVSLQGTAAVVGGGDILYRVNAGGPALAGTPGWESDTPSPYVNTGATAKSFSNVDLNHPSMPPDTPEALFDTERWDKPASPEMQWDFPVTAGTYEVRLYFAETYSGTQSVGARVFDVLIEGASVLDDYDIYADVGGNRAVMKAFMVTADANLDIDFLHVVQNPAVKGIEILQSDAIPGQLGVSPGSVDFGSVLVGGNGFESIELTNLGGSGDPDIEVQSALISGTDASEFNHDFAGPVTLSPGQSTLIGVTFGPLTGGAKSASLSISHDGANSPMVVPLEGSGVAGSSDLEASPSNVDFGTVSLGNSGTASIEISNVGQAGEPAIEVQSTQMSGTDAGEFSNDFSGPVTLSPGETATIGVTFTPLGGGSKSASMEIIHDGANSPVAVSLQGSAVETSDGPVVYRVNAGGPALAGTPGWESDTPSPYVNTGALATSFSNIDISHPSIPPGTPEVLFDTERWDRPEEPEMQWDFPVTAGTYEVRLYFAETYSGTQSVGARVFDVLIEGALVLDDYDIYADVGGDTAVMKAFVVTADANLDIDFFHGVQNPAIKGIEILDSGPMPGNLGASPAGIDFGEVLTGETVDATVQLSNLGESGDPDITVQSTSIIGTDTSEFSNDFPGSVLLQPGQSTTVTVSFTPATAGAKTAVLEISHDGVNSPVSVQLEGAGSDSLPVSFNKFTLAGTTGLTRPTSLQFGPDGRLYVSEQNGVIRVYDVDQDTSGGYSVTSEEVIDKITTMPNHDDNGVLNTSVTGRLVTGITVAGTSSNPVIYVNSSDPRIGAGPSGEDLNLDTNSGILSRLTWNGSSWDKLDLVRGLPRSEENHAPNGLYFDAVSNVIYTPTGGNTNAGATSTNFALLPEYALSTAILKIDLNAIGETTYDLPTLDDEDRAGTVDANDPFGGNDGKNQAMLVSGGPVQIHATGFRNAYEVVITRLGQMYTIDNGANSGWGDIPVNEGPEGICTNEQNEPGGTNPDTLHHVTEPGYYGGHPNPTRGNTANTFNTSNPQSPVPSANPIECDSLDIGVDNPALTSFDASTNGIAEYTALNFGNEMSGDLLAASFDNKIYRILLDGNGEFTGKTALVNNVGNGPLDVTVQDDNGEFPGTVWVASIFDSQIIALEPSSQSGCSGADDPSLDEDGDGFDNADEIDNGTDPCSAADTPPDADGDFTSDLNDNDDDNDGLLDTEDPFALDDSNGASTNLPVLYTWENDAPNPGGLLSLGFTGLMSNGVSDYLDLFDSGAMTAGGAAGVVTIDAVPAGDAGHAGADPDTQQYGFQFGINVDSGSPNFTARTRIVGPFSGLVPEDFQSLGLFIGNGDQDNYLKLVLTANGGFGGIELAQEDSGLYSSIAQDSMSLPGPDYVDLYIEVQPGSLMAQASYTVTTGGSTGPRTDLGGPVAIPSGWLNGPTKLAIGMISTSRGATPFPATWDFMEVEPETSSHSSQASLLIDTDGIDGSTYAPGSFQLTNQSQGGQRINRVTLDLGTAIFPDMVYDPDGTAGDTTAKGFTPDSGGTATGLSTHQFLSPHDNGYDGLQIDFTDFDPGEVFTFSVDVDPTSIQGSAAPGPNDSGSVSGLELSGSTLTIEFDDFSQHTVQLFAVPGSVSDSINAAKANVPAAVSAEVLGVVPPATVTDPNQTIRVTGPAGSELTLLMVEGGFFTTDGTGFDPDPYEANSAVNVTEIPATIDQTGSVDIPVTLTNSGVDTGLNYISVVSRDAAGDTGPVTPPIVLELSQ